MQRSDPPRPAGADPAAANSDPQKPAAESPSPEADAEAFTEAESEVTERTHFEELERETTQPVRRYFEPKTRTDITPSDVGYAVGYERPAGDTTPASGTEPPQADAVPLGPWPDPLPATAESGSEQYVSEPIFDEPAAAGEEEASPLSEVEVAPPAYEEPEPPQPPSAPTFEPSPFAVPAPRAAAPPSFEPHPVEPEYIEPWPAPESAAPASDVPQEAEPAARSHAPVSDHAEPEWGEPAREREPQPEPPPATLQHDVAAAWSPAPAYRREPTFARAEPSWQPPATATAPPLEPTARDYRDLFRRSVRVAVLVFCGWLIAVLLLIIAYRFINPPFSMLMAQQFLTGTAIHKQWVPIERISPNLTRAVIVAEDGRFCEHWASTSSRRRMPSAAHPTGIRAAPAPSPCRWRRTSSW